MATTTNYGWDTPDDTDLVKDGALAIRDLGQDVDTSLYNITDGKNVGLVPINTTTFTGITSTNISSVFSASYDNYRILVNIAQNSTFAANYIQLRTGVTTVTSNYDRRGVFLNSASTVSGSGTAGETSLLIGQTGNGGRSFHTIDFANPFLTVPTMGTVVTADNDSGGGRDMFLTSIFNSNSTSYESLVLGCTAGTITGTIRVYGYRNS
jgi:hypothetical protein